MLTLYGEGEALFSDPVGDQFRGYEATRFSTCGETIHEIYVPDDGRKTMEFSELLIADLSCRWVLWSFNASKLPMLVLYNPRTGHHVGTNIIYERGNSYVFSRWTIYSLCLPHRTNSSYLDLVCLRPRTRRPFTSADRPEKVS
jgi:hypothetical protein